MNADGSGQARLTTSAGMDVHPTWSPDGTRIAFVSTRDGNPNIYVMNAEGSGQTRLTSDSAPDYDPAWSPDGSRIVFASTRDLAAGALFLMNPDGSNVTRLPSSIGGERLPTWSPDGTRLAAVRDWIGVVQLDATGTPGTVLVPPDGTITGMSWSPDGRWLAYGVTACDYYYGGDCIARVMALTLDGTRRTLIMSDAREPTWPRSDRVTRLRVLLAAAVVLAACRDDPASVAPPVPLPVITAATATPGPYNVLSALVAVRTAKADSVAVRYGFAGTAGAGEGVTPSLRLEGDSATVPVLGLFAGSRYALFAVAYGPGGVTVSDSLLFITDTLPGDLPHYTAGGIDPSPGFVVFAAPPPSRS